MINDVSNCMIEWLGLVQRHNFFYRKNKNIPFPPQKRYLWRSGWRSTVQGSRHTWTLKKNIVSHKKISGRSIIPLSCWLSCWLLCWLLCCCHVVVVVFVYFVFVVTLPTLPPLPLLAPCCCCHRRWLVWRMTPATQTPIAAPPRQCMPSTGRWKPSHCWTGPYRPVARAAKVAMMMAALALAAEVGLGTRLVWSSPPPLEAAQRR
jgi:hypothetical protein